MLANSGCGIDPTNSLRHLRALYRTGSLVGMGIGMGDMAWACIWINARIRVRVRLWTWH
jgi:hypothetical protein